jgi:ketosteroid isomerase-like protein
MGTFSLGRPAPSRGKFVEIYRQQPDGSWRRVVDMFSNDEAAA